MFPKNAAAMSFKDLVDTTKPTQRVLPVCHTCTSAEYMRFLTAGKLELKLCDVFAGEHLLYLFYGKPSYRYSISSEDQAEHPVCFIIKPEAVDSIKRVYPFDSGAYDLNLYTKTIAGNRDKQEFEVAPEIASAQKIVSLFFETNRKYITRDEATSKSKIPAGNAIAQAYLNLILTPQPEADLRRRTIEIQSPEAIEISLNTVQYIIMPPHLVQHSRENLNRLGFRYGKTYDTYQMGGINGLSATFDLINHMAIVFLTKNSRSGL